MRCSKVASGKSAPRHGTRSPRFSEASVMARLPLEMWSHTHVVDRGGLARLVELDGLAGAEPYARHMSPRPTRNALIVCDPKSVCVGRKNEFEPRGLITLLGQGSRQKRGASTPHSLVMWFIVTFRDGEKRNPCCILYASSHLFPCLELVVYLVACYCALT